MSLSGTKVYIVSDCGQNWPAAGLIFGVYDNEDAAIRRFQALKENPEAVSGTNIEDVYVREVIINEDTSG